MCSILENVAEGLACWSGKGVGRIEYRLQITGYRLKIRGYRLTFNS